jgi:hypothetical protein
MVRLRIPPAPHEDLPRDTARPSSSGPAIPAFGRRRFLYGVSTLLAAMALPLSIVERSLAARRGRFLTRREVQTLEALCDRIIPADHDPGAKALGAARYIDGFLNAFERRSPRIFAGGPFSGRQPFPDAKRGRPSRRRPPNRFAHFVPLTRTQEMRWRAELYGSTTVPELAAIDGFWGRPLRGLRDVYRDGLATVDEVARAFAGRNYAALAAEAQDTVLAQIDDGVFEPDPRRGNRTFVDLLIQHTLEGCFAAPEYGGNRRGRGWEMLGLEGDSQPLGFSIYSSAIDGYVERDEHPMSTPNPDEVAAPRPLTADGAKIQDSIATLAGTFAGGEC